MLKACILAIAGFAATTSAASHSHTVQMDVFNAKNYFNGEAVMNLVQGAIKDLTHPRLTDGHVKFSSCPNFKADGFTIDSSKTYAKPDPVKKGIDVTLYLGGFATRDLEITSTTVSVTWDGVALYTGDFPDKKSVDEQDEYKTNLSWPVPGFAPSGHYNCKITINGVQSNGKVGPIACSNADFDL